MGGVQAAGDGDGACRWLARAGAPCKEILVARCGIAKPLVRVHPVGQPLRGTYDVETEPLGVGGTAVVHLCRQSGPSSSAPAVTRACKTMMRDLGTEDALIWREVAIWTKLLHGCTDGIVRLYEVYQEETYVHLVMELCDGGELYARQAQLGVFEEHEAQVLLRQMLAAVAQLHRLSIVHRDLKLENWLFGEADRLEPLKLADFGSSAEVVRGEQLFEKVGSPYYTAPEVLHGQGYGSSCDIWGLGVIAYMLLSGQPPFDGPSRETILLAVRLRKPEFNSQAWVDTSDTASEFVARLLTRDVTLRPDAGAAAADAWLARKS